jgi:hypothetical protein
MSSLVGLQTPFSAIFQFRYTIFKFRILLNVKIKKLPFLRQNAGLQLLAFNDCLPGPCGHVSSSSFSPPSQSCVFLTPQLRPSRGPRGPTPGGFTQGTMAFSSSLAPFFPPSGTFRAHPARRLRADAPGRFVASCLPPPDVVVTREQGKNARLISALVSLSMDPLSIVLSC